MTARSLAPNGTLARPSGSSIAWQCRASAPVRGRMFDMADANRDGRVTAAEAQNAALQHFDRVDANRDGTISPEERQRAREQMRAQRRS